MRTVVAEPASWQARGGVLASPDGGVTIEIGALVPAPLDGPAFVREVLNDADGEVRVVASQPATSACGWPYDRIECVVVDGDGRAREARIVAIYRFLARVAVIRVRAADPVALGAARAVIEAVFASARPDWRGDRIAALAELWADAPA
jgi:hypothetical protein